ncbi:MAG: metallophosphatase [Candidatus Omnitrophica bacterium]|nr:metallophosphatase [Candidatus Omnitrophota bacterium]MDD5652792.1 metallophosphatase [Candidatus Omnitrophota bacterium]
MSKSQCQNKFKILIFNFKTFVLNFGFFIFFVICALNFVIKSATAEEITILYTGDTHAALYPCNCPIEPDGGVARRATLVNQVRKANRNVLLLDSGSFFAGGQLDENTQNPSLDMQRTRINLQAMGLMRYDAVCVGDDEFNFGKDFLEEALANSNFVYLSANIRSSKIRPFAIKEIGGIKAGIVGLTSQRVVNKATGLEFIEPAIALKSAIEELKKEGADIIVLLSRLGEEYDLQLISQVSGVDVLITTYAKQNALALEKIGSTIVLRPSWQGRHLGKTVLKLKDKQIVDASGQDIGLSDKISNDPKIEAILPRCFRDMDCKKEGAVGSCINPGNIKAQCQFNQANKVHLLVIEPQNCIACASSDLLTTFKNIFPGLAVTRLYYPQEQAKKIITELKIDNLPGYLFGKEVDQEKKFSDFKERFELRGNYYLVKPQYSGISLFLGRKKFSGKLDLFISLFNKDTPGVLEGVKGLHPSLHFLLTENNGKFEALNGKPEVEEALRAVSVAKYYPDKFFNYISCRANNISSTWWEDCLSPVEAEKIRIVSRSPEAAELLKENIRLNKEVMVMSGPTYLVDNQEIFGTQGAVTEKELKKILMLRR